MTTLPGNGTRIRTAQGIGFSKYSSYYRETKFEDIPDGLTAKQQFLNKLKEIRLSANVPENLQTLNEWFDI